MKEIEIDLKKLGKKFADGFESILYYYHDPDNYEGEVLYKRFRAIQYLKQFNSNINDNMFENKYEKVLMIPTLKCFKDEIEILDIGIEYGKHLGYTMKKSNLKPLSARFEEFNVNGKIVDKLVYYGPNRQPLSMSDKIKYLRLLRDKIEKFNKSEVYIGDFNYENFLVSDNFDFMQLCDLDNLKMWSHDFDNKNNLMKSYEDNCMQGDEKYQNSEGLDSYCFNIFTLAFLYNEPILSILNKIDKIELPEILDEFPNKEIMESVKHLDKTYKPRYFVDIFK